MTNIANKTLNAYDSISKSVANSTTDYDWKTTGGGFGNAVKSSFVSIRTDAEITVKLNETTNDGIVIASTDSPFEIDNKIFITNLYISNASGGAAAVQVFNV